jgi:threonine/homoserine/homoserine lactone efflux protein
MLGIHDLALFIIAGVALNLTPGPDMALVARRAAAHGARAGAAAVGAGARAARRVSGSLAPRRWLDAALGVFFMLLAARLVTNRSP